jgi:hypothetical protein
MTHESPAHRTPVTLVALILVTIITLLVAAIARADEASDRLSRKTRVMEKVLDEVLDQSKNIHVGMCGKVAGVTLDDTGIVFIFRGTLVGSMEAMESLSELLEAEDDRDADDEVPHLAPPVPPAPVSPGKGRSGKGRSLQEMRKEAMAKRQEHLDALKKELIDAVLDYGPTLADLGDEKWVTVLGFLGEEVFDERGSEDRSQILVKGRIRDLRQLAGGTTSRSAVISKLIVEAR